MKMSVLRFLPIPNTLLLIGCIAVLVCAVRIYRTRLRQHERDRIFSGSSFNEVCIILYILYIIYYFVYVHALSLLNHNQVFVNELFSDNSVSECTESSNVTCDSDTVSGDEAELIALNDNHHHQQQQQQEQQLEQDEDDKSGKLLSSGSIVDEETGHSVISQNRDFIVNHMCIASDLKKFLMQRLTHNEKLLWADVPIYHRKHRGTLQRIIVYQLLTMMLSVLFAIICSGVVTTALDSM